MIERIRWSSEGITMANEHTHQGPQSLTCRVLRGHSSRLHHLRLKLLGTRARLSGVSYGCFDARCNRWSMNILTRGHRIQICHQLLGSKARLPGLLPLPPRPVQHIRLESNSRVHAA